MDNKGSDEIILTEAQTFFLKLPEFARRPSLSVWKFRDNEMENRRHTYFSALDVEGQDWVCFLFWVTDV